MLQVLSTRNMGQLLYTIYHIQIHRDDTSYYLNPSILVAAIRGKWIIDNFYPFS